MLTYRTAMTFKCALLTYLPRFVAEQAINNRINQNGPGSENDKIDCDLNGALSDAFIWDNTPERRRYWENVNGEYLNNL